MLIFLESLELRPYFVPLNYFFPLPAVLRCSFLFVVCIFSSIGVTHPFCSLFTYSLLVFRKGLIISVS